MIHYQFFCFCGFFVTFLAFLSSFCLLLYLSYFETKMKTPLLLILGFWMWERGQTTIVNTSGIYFLWCSSTCSMEPSEVDGEAGREGNGDGIEDWCWVCWLQPGGHSSRFLVFSSFDIRSPYLEPRHKKCVQSFLKMLIWAAISVCSKSETAATRDFRLNILFRLSSFSSKVGKKNLPVTFLLYVFLQRSLGKTGRKCWK